MKKYVNSGKFNIGSVIVWTLIGIVAGAVISVAYTFIAHYIPSIWLNVFALIGLALVLTWATVFCVKRSKSRNRAVNVIMALLIGLIAWYVSWATIIAYVWEVSFFEAILRPGALFPAMSEYMENMQWSVGRSKTPIGPLMNKLSYLVELIWFLLPTILVATKKLYYCEFCEQFMKPKDHFIPEVSIVNDHLDHIREGDLAFLDQVQLLAKMDTAVDEQYKINLHRCEGCGERIFNFYHLRMKHKKGKTEIDRTTDIVENIYASRPVSE